MCFIHEAFHTLWPKTFINENNKDESARLCCWQNKKPNFGKCCPPVDISPDSFVSKLDFLRSCPCSSLNKKISMYPIQSFEICICVFVCVFVSVYAFCVCVGCCLSLSAAYLECSRLCSLRQVERVHCQVPPVALQHISHHLQKRRK